MESIEEASTNIDMGYTDKNSESSRLVDSSPVTKPSYMNIASNICAVMVLGIMIYCSFEKGVSLFSFHPTLMTLGWIVFMTSAINAVTPGDLATEWMPMRLRSARHWVLQFLSVTVS
ncbi:unnamed protein product [Arctia plantaginis]|uniref:Cytochrome b561 domain-containing protein n=1 Tax=Arctia plantaginis TaxID=874455 RepID=A0A8S0YYY8_ARCPL|nr:unnamed protein product [Arctia plantaginis]